MNIIILIFVQLMKKIHRLRIWDKSSLANEFDQDHIKSNSWKKSSVQR